MVAVLESLLSGLVCVYGFDLKSSLSMWSNIHAQALNVKMKIKTEWHRKGK